MKQIFDITGSERDVLFETLCREGLYRRYGGSPDNVAEERLVHEIKVVQNMGYADPFLILCDAVRYAKENEIPVAPGYGALPGSLCAYCLGITDIDPIKYNLLFERFLNSGTDRAPAFSIAVEHLSRLKIINYLIGKYGTERTASIEVDVLGINKLSEIAEAQRIIRQTEPTFSIDSIPLDAPEFYLMLSSGNSNGVTWIAAHLYEYNLPRIEQILKEFKPDSFEHLIALYAMYRPGTIDLMQDYIENKTHPDRVKYPTPQLEAILGVTHGVIIYQEQIMQIFEKLAGYSPDRADLARRNLAKKRYVEHECKVFIHGLEDENGAVIVDGCLRRGINEETANELFDSMSSVASYVFCRAHAAAYALIVYRTAYLRCFYPEVWNMCNEGNTNAEN